MALMHVHIVVVVVVIQAPTPVFQQFVGKPLLIAAACAGSHGNVAMLWIHLQTFAIIVQVSQSGALFVPLLVFASMACMHVDILSAIIVIQALLIIARLKC